MKQYKLIKEYPGSWKKDTIVEFDKNSDRCLINGVKSPITAMQVLNYPEFWQEITKPEYTILSFDTGMGLIIIRTKNDDWVFEEDNGHTDWRYKTLLEECYIHSVRRESDGEVFTVGDDIKNQRDIQSFRIFPDGELLAMFNNNQEGLRIDLLYKREQPLFTTEDEVDIYEGDMHWFITGDMGYCGQKASSIDKGREYGHTFSTKEKAEEYILENKPCLSLKDLYRVRFDNESLIKLVKQKLKQ